MATKISNLRPSTNQLRQLGNWSQMFRWGIQIDPLPTALSGQFDSTQINFRAVSATVPEKTGESTMIQIRGNKVKQPGIHEYNSPWNCTLSETIDAYGQRFVYAWHSLCWQSENGVGITEMKADLEAKVHLYMLNNKDEAYYQYTLIGVFLESASKGDADGSTSEPMQINLGFSYDYFTEKSLV